MAVTYLSPELLVDTEFRSRFAREFPRLARVRDTRVTRVHRYLECDHGAAVIGDHVKGISLRALLLAHGAVGVEAALVVLKDSLLALAACHKRGLAHGDLKPEDMVLTSAGRVRLVDFGLWTSGGRQMLGRSTPFYLAPEQWGDRPATPAGDVYAATVTFFECLVGAPPFHANAVAELSAKHERNAAPIEVVSEPVRELVARGLAKDPRGRVDALSMLAHVGDVAANSFGRGWERRGRRELAALLGGRCAQPDISAVARRSGGAWRDRKPVRLAAVMGGALALAAGLSSPPLAVILPGASIFSPGGRSPVLAFPEPDHDSVPVRVVTNGLLADRAAMPAKGGTAGPVARARPPAPSIPAPTIHTAPYEPPTPDTLHQGSAQPDGPSPSQSTSGQPAPDQSKPASAACDQGLIESQKPCTAMSPEQSTSDSDATPSDMVSIPVSMPVQLPVQVPAQVPAPAQVPKSIPVRKKIHPHVLNLTESQHQTDSRGWEKARTGEATGEPTDQTESSSGDSGSKSGRSGYNSGHSGDSDR